MLRLSDRSFTSLVVGMSKSILVICCFFLFLIILLSWCCTERWFIFPMAPLLWSWERPSTYVLLINCTNKIKLKLNLILYRCIDIPELLSKMFNFLFYDICNSKLIVVISGEMWSEREERVIPCQRITQMKILGSSELPKFCSLHLVLWEKKEY